MVNLFSFGCHVIDRAYASTDCTGEVGETITKEGRDVSGVSREIHIFFIGRGGGGVGTPIHYLYGYVPSNGVVILKLLIWNGVSI